MHTHKHPDLWKRWQPPQWQRKSQSIFITHSQTPSVCVRVRKQTCAYFMVHTVSSCCSVRSSGNLDNVKHFYLFISHFIRVVGQLTWQKQSRATLYEKLFIMNQIWQYQKKAISPKHKLWLIDVDTTKDFQVWNSREELIADDTHLMLITCFHYLMALNQGQSAMCCGVPEVSRFSLQLSTTLIWLMSYTSQA